MANSPLIIPPSSTEKIKSKSSLQVPASNGATPESTSGYASGGTVRDLAEQMNEEEKNKWIKGASLPPSASQPT